jgi:chemotaxis protein CheD
MLTVGIGEYVITKKEDENIITHALGSCVAFILYCPESKNTALAHIVLPKMERLEQYTYLQRKPSYFANIIVPKILDDFLKAKGCRKDMLQVALVGGANAQNSADIFKVGAKNIEMIKTLLRGYDIKAKKIDVGGFVSRTVQINVANGEIKIKSQNMII